MTEKLPEDTMDGIEIDSRIVELVDKCARLKTAKDAADKAFKMAKSELETLCDERGVKEIITGEHTAVIKKSKRFSAYRDPDAVFALIPEEVRDHAVSLDRKKINELIKDGVLPNAIKDLEMHTESVSTTFKKV